MRRRISARFVGSPILNWIGCLFVLMIGWGLWLFVGVDTLVGTAVIAVYLTAAWIGLYGGSRVRKIEVDQSNLYVGRFLRSGWVTIPLAQVQRIRPSGFWSDYHATITFRDKTDVGRWILLKPRPPFWPTLSKHPDLVELMDLVKQAQREPAHLRESATAGGEHDPSAESS